MTENLKQQRNVAYWWSLNWFRTLAVFVVNIWKTISRLTLYRFLLKVMKWVWSKSTNKITAADNWDRILNVRSSSHRPCPGGVTMVAVFLLTHGSSQWNQSRGCISLLHIAESSFFKNKSHLSSSVWRTCFDFTETRKSPAQTGSEANKGRSPAGGGAFSYVQNQPVLNI